MHAVPSVSWPQVLAWRLRRHDLEPIGTLPVEALAARLCGVQAQVASAAELAVRLRSEAVGPGGVAEALTAGRVVRTWAMRGTLHLLDPELGPALLALLASGRSWERPSWTRAFGATPAVIERLRAEVRAALDDGPLAREELAVELARRPGVDHLAELVGGSWGMLLKPLAWQGDLVQAGSRGTRMTFTLPERACPTWPGIPDPDAAAPRAIAAYLRAYGPATPARFGTWLAGGYFGQRRLRAWFTGMGDRLAEVDVDGDRAWVLAEDLDELRAARPSGAVRLLGGFDQYVLGPGTDDGHVTPAARRSAVSRPAGWIAPVVLAGGRVAGTWALDGAALRIDWFPEAGPVPQPALAAEARRLGSILGVEARIAVGTAT